MNRFSMPVACLRCLSAAAVLTAIAGCAVGPDFKRPETPKAASYTPAPLPATTASVPGSVGAAQDFSTARDIPAEWWALFQSPALDSLIKRAFAANPTIESAHAALAEAQPDKVAEIPRHLAETPARVDFPVEEARIRAENRLIVHTDPRGANLDRLEIGDRPLIPRRFP